MTVEVAIGKVALLNTKAHVASDFESCREVVDQPPACEMTNVGFGMFADPARCLAHDCRIVAVAKLDWLP
jgi:hypothetical protein